MLEMARKEIFPAVAGYVRELSDTVLAKRDALAGAGCLLETSLISRLSALSDSLYERAEALEQTLSGTGGNTDLLEKAQYYRDRVFAAMQELRAAADEAETLCSREFWPYPTYGEILFGV